MTLVKTASVDEQTNNTGATVHVTYVKPYRFDWEDEGSELNMCHFTYSTPFTEKGAAHGSVKTQQKRRTFLRVKSRLPGFIGRAEVTHQWSEVLNPLQVARDDIHAKTLALFESLKSDDTRIIQLLLQGAIQTQVNQVRTPKRNLRINLNNQRDLNMRYFVR